MKSLISMCLLALSAFPLIAAEYYVSPSGADSNNGSKNAPFQTVQHAAQKMKPGDVCWLRAGRYRKETILKDLKGLPDKPLVFKAFPGERVVFDGTAKLPARWSPWKDGIYQLKSDRAIWQLFTGEKLVYVARWPNASFGDGSMWRMEECMRFTDRDSVRGKPTGQTTDGLIHDRNPKSSEGNSAEEGAEALQVNERVNQITLAETGVDFTGAIAVLNLHHWMTWARPITDHKRGRTSFRYDSHRTEMATYVGYYILGLPALDRPNEWWYDSRGKTIYFRPPRDRDPNQLTMYGKVQDYNLRVVDCSYVSFQGIEFFATTFSITDCNHVVIEDSKLTYPSTNKFMLGDFNWFSTSYDSDKSSRASSSRNVMTRIVNHGAGPFRNVVRNCEIAYANSPAIAVNSPGSIVESCYIHDIEWDVNSSGGSGTLPTGAGSIIRRNTIHTGGNSEGIRPGPGSLVEYNRLWDLGKLQHDGSAINIGTGAQKEALVRHNWVHDTNRAAIRFDSTATRMGAGGCVHHNVVFNIDSSGSKFKGDHHLLFNNTFHDTYFAIPNKFGATTNHNRNTLVLNNLSDAMVAWSIRKPNEEINARLKKNVSGSGVVLKHLRDPANLDFRPRSGSAIIDAGSVVTLADKPTEETNVSIPKFSGDRPDIGAYEFGDTRYWIPGRRQARASTPVPPDGATGVKLDANLMFLEAYAVKRHVVYFANAANDHKGKLELQGSNIATPGKLHPGQTYTWRVDAIMPDGKVVKGAKWSFTAE